MGARENHGNLSVRARPLRFLDRAGSSSLFVHSRGKLCSIHVCAATCSRFQRFPRRVSDEVTGLRRAARYSPQERSMDPRGVFSVSIVCLVIAFAVASGESFHLSLLDDSRVDCRCTVDIELMTSRLSFLGRFYQFLTINFELVSDVKETFGYIAWRLLTWGTGCDCFVPRTAIHSRGACNIECSLFRTFRLLFRCFDLKGLYSRSLRLLVH